MTSVVRAAVIALLSLTACATPATAAVPSSADWYEFYISDSMPYPVGEPKLHADLLVPKGTDLTDAKLPIMVSVGPYFGHGSDPMSSASPGDDGPNLQWRELIGKGKLFERGYGLLQVDLRGFGGSQGCTDWGGPGEQLDTFRAVEWAARQPWSSGKVAIFGMSYPAWTGLMALDEKPAGLGAAIIQSPLISGYRGVYQDGVHYELGWHLTPVHYSRDNLDPPSADDVMYGRFDYVTGWATSIDPACYARNIALVNGMQKHDDAAGFWRARDLPGAYGSAVPVFWSHGFLDINTKPDNFESVWSTLSGPKRAWFGQYDHVRPSNEAVGRSEYYWQELFAFLGEHIRGGPHVDLPTVEVEDSSGRWRAEAEWPPADGVARSIALRSGGYTDTPASSDGVWSVTPPLNHDAWIAGVVRAQIDLTTTVPDATVIARLYDIDPATGAALLISRGAGKVVDTGTSTKQLELYPADYLVSRGHRLAVFVTANDPLYLPPPSGQRVEVAGGALTAPFLTWQRTAFLPGRKSQPDRVNRDQTTIDEPTITANPTTWEEPPALQPRP